MHQMLDRLNQAMDDMRDAASSQQAGTPQGEAQARRAAERLKEAEQMLAGMRGKESSNQVDDLARQAEDWRASSRPSKARCAGRSARRARA